MGTIRSIYTFFLQKRKECVNETLCACMDIILVITGDYFHQKYCHPCSNKHHLNEGSRNLFIIFISTTHSRCILRQNIHTLRIDVQNRIFHPHSEVSQLLRDLFTSIKLLSYPHTSSHVKPRLDAEHHTRCKGRIDRNGWRVIVVQPDEMSHLWVICTLISHEMREVLEVKFLFYHSPNGNRLSHAYSKLLDLITPKSISRRESSFTATACTSFIELSLTPPTHTYQLDSSRRTCTHFSYTSFRPKYTSFCALFMFFASPANSTRVISLW